MLASLKQVSVIESTESSNRLEGITAPPDRAEHECLHPAAPA